MGGIAAVNYLGGSRPITEIKVGDCFDVDAEELIDDVTKRDCTDPHQYELFFVGDLPGETFPPESDINAWVDANCTAAFTAYVGIDVGSTTLSPLIITPTQETWDSGDRSVQCALEDPNDPQLTESMQGAAR